KGDGAAAERVPQARDAQLGEGRSRPKHKPGGADDDAWLSHQFPVKLWSIAARRRRCPRTRRHGLNLRPPAHTTDSDGHVAASWHIFRWSKAPPASEGSRPMRYGPAEQLVGLMLELGAAHAGLGV